MGVFLLKYYVDILGIGKENERVGEDYYKIDEILIS